MNRKSEDLSPAAAGKLTPLISISVHAADLQHTLLLKDERQNPTGSIKDRTATALVDRAVLNAVRAGSPGLVESTSGNLGAALALRAGQEGFTFRAVVDPRLSPNLADKIIGLGGELDVVKQADPSGNFLMARLDRVQQLVRMGWVWTNQYTNPAVAQVHLTSTGPEIFTQLTNRVDELLVAVSTGGTLAGLGAFAHARWPTTKVVAVDVEGSVVFAGPPAPRYLTGIGSARTSDFDLAGCHDAVEIVSETEAIELCHRLLRELGIGVGPSTGAVVAAFIGRTIDARAPLHGLGLVADGATNYARTIFDRQWLASHGYRRTGTASTFPVRLTLTATIASKGVAAE